MEKTLNYPPLEELKTLTEEEVRAWFGKVRIWRDEHIDELRHQQETAIFNIRTEQKVERNRIICLIDLKRSQLPTGGNTDERERTLTLRNEIHNLDYEMQTNDINSRKKIADIKYESKRAINDIQRQWETATGTLKQALAFVCNKTED